MKLSAISAVIVPLLSVSLFPMPSLAEHGQGSTIIKSVSVTGSFQRYGQPLWDLGEPFGAPGGPGGEHVAEYNPFGDEPIPLSSDTSCDAVLATVLDPNSSNYDMDEINIPLNEVPITVDGEGHTAQLPPITEAAPTEQSRSLPNDPITLGDWLAADGTARIRCQSEDEATVSIWFRNLAPNGLYTMWGFMATDSHSIGALPLGGVPNAFIANRYGRGWFERTLNYCPTDPDSSLFHIIVAPHSDGQTFGAVPGMAGAEMPKRVGVVVHAQLAFPVNGTALPVEDGCSE